MNLDNLVANAAPYVGSVVQFVAGVVAGALSTYYVGKRQERDRREHHVESLRQALIGELRRERFVGLLVRTFYGAREIADEDLEEIRFFFRETSTWEPEIADRLKLPLEMQRVADEAGDNPLRAIASLSPAYYKAMLMAQPPYADTAATDVPMPILDAILAALPPGWDATRLGRLSYLKWNAYMLKIEAERMNTFMMMTFDESLSHENAQTVRANHDHAKRSYLMRVRSLLARARGAQRPRPGEPSRWREVSYPVGGVALAG